MAASMLVLARPRSFSAFIFLFAWTFVARHSCVMKSLRCRGACRLLVFPEPLASRHFRDRGGGRKVARSSGACLKFSRDACLVGVASTVRVRTKAFSTTCFFFFLLAMSHGRAHTGGPGE